MNEWLEFQRIRGKAFAIVDVARKKAAFAWYELRRIKKRVVRSTEVRACLIPHHHAECPGWPIWMLFLAQTDR